MTTSDVDLTMANLVNLLNDLPGNCFRSSLCFIWLTFTMKGFVTAVQQRIVDEEMLAGYPDEKLEWSVSYEDIIKRCPKPPDLIKGLARKAWYGRQQLFARYLATDIEAALYRLEVVDGADDIDEVGKKERMERQDIMGRTVAALSRYEEMFSGSCLSIAVTTPR